MAKTLSQILSEISSKILTGGRRTTATNTRSVLNDIADSALNKKDGGLVIETLTGYTTTITPTDDKHFVTKKYVDDHSINETTRYNLEDNANNQDGYLQASPDAPTGILNAPAFNNYMSMPNVSNQRLWYDVTLGEAMTANQLVCYIGDDRKLYKASTSDPSKLQHQLGLRLASANGLNDPNMFITYGYITLDYTLITGYTAGYNGAVWLTSTGALTITKPASNVVYIGTATRFSSGQVELFVNPEYRDVSTGGGGGISEPTTDGNWLRSKASSTYSWLEGVLKSTYDSFVSSVNATFAWTKSAGVQSGTTLDWGSTDISTITGSGSVTINSISNLTDGVRNYIISGYSSFGFNTSLIPASSILGNYIAGQTNKLQVTNLKDGEFQLIWGNVMLSRTSAITFDGVNVTLDNPIVGYAEYQVTNNTAISVASTNKIGAGAILLLKGDGSHSKAINGSELADTSFFDTRNNYVTPVYFFNGVDKIRHRFDTSYLSTNVAPSITTQPSSTGVVEGATATFSLVAAGTAPLSYQWRRGGTNISGATSSSYTTGVTTVAGDNGATFDCVVTNTYGTVTTVTVTLTVTVAGTAPSFTTNPSNLAVNNGYSATFTVVATGSSPITYQWQISTNGGTTWSNISGETSATYTRTTALYADNNAQFRCVATNTNGTVNSSVAVLTVSPLNITVYMSSARDKIYIVADRDLAASPSSSGYTLSGGRTVSSIIRDSSPDTYIYIITPSSAYSSGDTVTIGIANSTLSAVDGSVYYAVSGISVPVLFDVSANVVESPANTYASNTATSWQANGACPIALPRDFIIESTIDSVSRGSVIGVKSSNTVGGFDTSYLYYTLINTSPANDVIAGKDGVNNSITAGSFVSATDTKLRLRRLSGVFTAQVLRSGTWTTIYTLSGTNSATLYAVFSIVNNTSSNKLVKPIVRNI